MSQSSFIDKAEKIAETYAGNMIDSMLSTKVNKTADEIQKEFKKELTAILVEAFTSFAKEVIGVVQSQELDVTSLTAGGNKVTGKIVSRIPQ